MEINNRIIYVSYLIVGLIMIIAGVALSEHEMLADAFNQSAEDWYTFLMPWLGDSEKGIPTPW